ncbi:MAG: MoaD/ThiS family protein [Gammaproteobacteria bacterium]
MRVFLSSHLRDYTGGRADIAAAGGDLIALMDDLDRQYPGLKFRLVDEQGRLRPHLNVFINQLPIRDLRKRLSADDRIDILAALSGG